MVPSYKQQLMSRKRISSAFIWCSLEPMARHRRTAPTLQKLNRGTNSELGFPGKMEAKEPPRSRKAWFFATTFASLSGLRLNKHSLTSSSSKLAEARMASREPGMKSPRFRG